MPLAPADTELGQAWSQPVLQSELQDTLGHAVKQTVMTTNHREECEKCGGKVPAGVLAEQGRFTWTEGAYIWAHTNEWPCIWILDASATEKKNSKFQYHSISQKQTKTPKIHSKSIVEVHFAIDPEGTVAN